jgi:predicted metallopeptidase
MPIKYEISEEIMNRICEIVRVLDEDHKHVRLSGVYAVRSYGSQSRRTIARCHALGKIWQLALGIKAVYIIEVISERFDKMSQADQDRVLIHEIMHIPKSFGGGFTHHNVVNDRNVEIMYQKYLKAKENEGGKQGWF